MRIRAGILALGWCMLAATAVGQQQPSVTLRVAVADRSGIPVAGVLVQLFGPTRSPVDEARTDEAGHASFSHLHPGSYELRVSDPMFTDVHEVLELHEGLTQVPVTLLPTSVQERITVTASRGSMFSESDVPATVRLLDQQQLRERAADLLPRMLDEEPGVLTQQTTPGQGSPILRGQSAQAVLYLIDGIRFNNATYRGGNTQYLAWIPDVGVDSVETLLGPAAVNYGSDALGGAINVQTLPTPALATGPVLTHGTARAFGESSTLGGGGNLVVGVSASRATGYMALSGARHQDLRGGGGRDSHHATVRFLGLSRNQARALFGGRDVDTSYSQWGLSAKGALRVGTSSAFTGYLTASEQFDVRRYDRLLGGDGRVRADFTPQRLLFSYLRYERILNDTFFDATASVNRQVDGRIDQRRPTSPVRTERTTVTAVGFETAVSKALDEHLPTLGLELYDEHVDALRTETLSGITRPVRPRFPDGARYTSFGVFLLDDFSVADNALQLSLGTRYSAFHYSVRAADNVIGGMPLVPDATATFDDLTLNAGATWQFVRSAHLWGRVARGFRAPSVFDLGEIGLTGGGFEVSPDEPVRLGARVGESAGADATGTSRRWKALKPEVLWSFETGFRWFSDRLRVELTAFDSEFHDAISRRLVILDRPVVGETIGGETILRQDQAGRVFVAADPDPVVSRANIGRMRVWGLELLAQRALNDRLMATLKASLQRGRELDTGLFARKIAPDNMTLLLRWRSRSGNLWVEGIARGARPQRRLNPGDLADPRIGAFRDARDIADFFNNQGPRLGLVQNGVLLPTGETLDEVIARVLGPDGVGRPLFSETPGWFTLGVRGSWQMRPGQSLSISLSNLTDTNYRQHGSGFDAPGINATVSYSADF